MLSLILIFALGTSAFYKNMKFDIKQEEDDMTDDEKTVMSAFKGTKGVIPFNEKQIEYNVISYMAGYQKEYLAMVQYNNQKRNGRSRSAHKAVLQAIRELGI
ncbi:hypothetical protein EIN_503270 [Entamoeba invadens IP1]|uniref:Uncharacterized protein n=1 Tax=Entamoeba invadens IP1 TaxID=370355 RepID=A0A0A1U797_ENTIV|nr:hypothetical protein EIN_503270 [Entamoeba invadens IP1]ELP90271.1 hypothetical protein EIN_503270 [Entamoeba invadens IP1]|eukprot:XP_004257042.1 hypothetical protein EIN_503270 [Entamoeba invadens IP1]